MTDLPRRRSPRPWPWALAVLAVVVVGFAGLHLLGARETRARAGLAAAELVVRQLEAMIVPVMNDDGVPAQTRRVVSAAQLDQAVGATRDAFRRLDAAASGADVDRLEQLVAEASALLRGGDGSAPGLAAAIDRRAEAARAVSLHLGADQRRQVRATERQTIVGQVLVVAVVGLLVLVVLRAARSAFEAEADRHTADLVELAHRDPLTGAANRRSLARDAAAIASPDGAEVLVLDLDGFKQLNDRLGHAAGDRLLVDIARSLDEHLDGTVYRIGGDEFCVVAPATDRDLAVEAERLVGAVASGGVTASVGVARLPDEADGLLAALRVADARMYAAKTARRPGGSPAYAAAGPMDDGDGAAC